MSPVYGYRNVAGVGVTVGGGSPAVLIFLNLLAGYSPPHNSIRARLEVIVAVELHTIACMFRNVLNTSGTC